VVGEYVRRRGSEAASSEVESRPRGRMPSSEEETHLRGRFALERDGDSPEGVLGP
jgi:hypothetical protein